MTVIARVHCPVCGRPFVLRQAEDDGGLQVVLLLTQHMNRAHPEGPPDKVVVRPKTD